MSWMNIIEILTKKGVSSMMRKAVFTIILALLAAGCATVPYRNDSLEKLQTLPQQYEQFDAKLAWDISTDVDTTVINGVIKNIRYFEMNDLEIQVALLGANGREGHRDTYFIAGLKENEAAPFILKLPAVAPGSTLRFRYRYMGYEGGGNSGGDSGWRQSFDWNRP